MAEAAFTWTALVRPVCELGMSDERQPEPDEWLDISCNVIEAELYRGRDRFTDRFDVGTASITFRNGDGWADLVGSPAVVATQTLRPGRPIRVGVWGPWSESPPTVRWLWRGWIDQATPSYDPVEFDIVVINAIDALGEAGKPPAVESFFQGVGEPAATRIGRVLDQVAWFDEKRKLFGDIDPSSLQGTSFGAKAIDLMAQAADSGGGVVFGDLDGDVVYRFLDWMLYDPDDPPDGTIGNVDPGVPGIPYVPGYIDPGIGYVYDPGLPPLTPGGSIKICAGEGEGTLLEQGDGVDVFVQGGRIYFRWGGQLWDLGEYSGGCVEIEIPSESGSPPRIRPINGDGDPTGDWTDGDEVPPEDQPALIELLAFTQSGEADTPQLNTVLGPITPGPDRWLVVLLTTVDGLENDSPLSPSIEGGPGDWVSVDREDAGPLGGASSFVWACEPIRGDPGGFSIVVDWAGETRSHACTVWGVRQMRSDFRAHLDDGLVLHAVTDSTPLEPEPGDGAQSVALEPVTTIAAAGDHVIAQSIASEGTGPFGAVFETETPDWVVPVEIGGTGPVLLAGEWADDFERADGAIGTNWVLWTTVRGSPGVPLVIDGGAAIASEIDGDPSAMYWHQGQEGNQAIGIEIEHAIGNNGYFWLYTNVNGTDAASEAIEINFFDGDDDLYIALVNINADGSFDFLADVTLDYPTEPATIRFESDADGTQRVYVDDALALTYVDPSPNVGPYVAMSMEPHSFGGVYDSPRILAAGGTGGVALVASWVAGYRPLTGTNTTTVDWADVNTGVDDEFSAQAALVVELAVGDLGGEGGIILGGFTNPYTGEVYSAGAYEGDDEIWSWFPGVP